MCFYIYLKVKMHLYEYNFHFTRVNNLLKQSKIRLPLEINDQDRNAFKNIANNSTKFYYSFLIL